MDLIGVATAGAVAGTAAVVAAAVAKPWADARFGKDEDARVAALRKQRRVVRYGVLAVVAAGALLLAG